MRYTICRIARRCYKVFTTHGQERKREAVTMSDYAAIEKEARIFTEECVTNNRIDPTLFAQYDIKRGLRDKNGKGVLVAAGAILAIQPVLLPFLAIIFLVCLIPTGMVSLGSVAMAALYPVLTIIYGSLQGYAAGDMLVCAIGSGFMSGMVIYMNRANIQRIREGKEYRFGKHNKK